MDIERLTDALGARISGVDLSERDAVTNEFIRQAFHENLVLVFPGQALSAADQIEFTELFGPVEPHPLRTRACVDGYPAVLKIENRPGRPGARNDYWHSDISHAETPPAVSVLHAITVPEGRGDTMFCNMYRALDNLPAGLRARLTGLNALHSGQATYTRSLEHNDARNIDPTEVQPPRVHPAIRTHPATGKSALFVNAHFTIGFEGMDDEDGKALIDELETLSTEPSNVYRHRWSPGDVVMWDNRCTMHNAVRDYADDMPRLLHRTTAGGEAPYFDPR